MSGGGELPDRFVHEDDIDVGGEVLEAEVDRALR